MTNERSKGFYQIGIGTSNAGRFYIVKYMDFERGSVTHRQGGQGEVLAKFPATEEGKQAAYEFARKHQAEANTEGK